jgi:predicted anti-sigma-YlaC factor YlaD
MPRLRLLACAALVVTALSGCSLKTMAVKTVANTLSESGDVFSRDDDPELVGDALPFALKLYESLLDSVPNHAPLLVATCSGFTQYAYAFVQTEADIIREDNYERATELESRALRLYLRGRDYCLRALDLRFRGASATLTTDAAATLARAERRDVELLYWTAASWGSAIALAPDRPDLLIDFPTVRALIDRAAALDETWGTGSIHEVLITLESLESLGGSLDKAREHFTRAVELQQGTSPGPYVALATGVSVARQDRAEFEKLLDQALAIDPEASPSTRLVTLITQRRARALRERTSSFFAQ